MDIERGGVHCDSCSISGTGHHSEPLKQLVSERCVHTCIHAVVEPSCVHVHVLYIHVCSQHVSSVSIGYCFSYYCTPRSCQEAWLVV